MVRETTPAGQRQSGKSCQCGPPIGGWVERDLNMEDTPRNRRWDFVGETEEVESGMCPAVLDKLGIMGRWIRPRPLTMSGAVSICGCRWGPWP